MSENKIITYFKNNKSTYIIALIILIIAGTWTYLQDKELSDVGETVEGVIVECDMVRLNGSCVVKIEFITMDGEKRVSENTLYNKNNCLLGKKVKLRYSKKSNLTDVVEG